LASIPIATARPTPAYVDQGSLPEQAEQPAPDSRVRDGGIENLRDVPRE
jgi:hypothetical protein